MTPVTKLRTFEIAFRVNGIGVEGYEKPNNAQIANTKNIPPKENKEYFDILIRGDHVKRAKLDISQESRGKKRIMLNNTAGSGGWFFHIVIKSKGSSKNIGAAIVPTIALPKAAFSPWCLLKNAIPMNVTSANRLVIGLIGLGGGVMFPNC